MSRGELAGTFNARVALHRPTGGRDDMGGADGETEEIGWLWLAVRESEGKRWTALARWPCAARIGDRLEVAGRRMRVAAVEGDIVTSDRVTLFLEAAR